MSPDDEPEGDPPEKDDDDDVTFDFEETNSDDAERSKAARAQSASFGPLLPAGFAQSLLPNLNSLAAVFQSASVTKPFSAAALGFKYESSTNALAKQIQAQHAQILGAASPMRSVMERFERQLGDFQRVVAPYTKTFAELPRLLLPPNLREVSDSITATDVLDFLEEEGIPLYLIPRAAIGKRLVLAKDHASRRRVLSDRFTHLVEDCAALLDTCIDPIVVTEVHFIRDGIGALKAGHHAAAQAIFTVTLDTLISRFYPDKNERRQITNRQKGAPMPDKISDMGVRQAYVWLPVWNAHQEYWQHRGDRIPNDYSRHATVHGVSKTQFNKRNCVQRSCSQAASSATPINWPARRPTHRGAANEQAGRVVLRHTQRDRGRTCRHGGRSDRSGDR